ncbi:BrnA antitoxin family protein [Marinobacter sp. F3R11]|uniref:BrnA antitoxin family protein n=1 Tax=Marinobacter sp. F3R11 TaxID=2267231 RepID=UPI001C9DB7EF|nr:BrnA antitoxin family protein [Marinobacter sp. F3R11]
MAKSMKKIKGTPDAWENGELGREEEYVRVSKSVSEDALNAAAELHPISIRLQKSLIEDFKMIADIHGIGYQPLIRQVLKRFADSEKKRILREKSVEMGSTKAESDSVDDCHFEDDCAAVG